MPYSTDLTGLSPRWEGWRFAALAAVASVVISALLSFVVPGLLGQHSWWMNRDVWWTTASARWVADGAIGTVYQANPWYSALPGFLVLYAPLVALGDHFNLVVGIPNALPRPSFWLLTGPFFFLVGATSVLGLDYLARTAGLARKHRRALVGSLAVFGVPPTLVYAGHPEDLLALALACVALALLIRGRYRGAGATLAVAILIQTWTGLLLPVFVAMLPAGRRLRGLLDAAVLPACVGLSLLALDWSNAAADLLGQPMPARGQHLLWWDVARHVRVIDHGQPLTVVAGSSSRIGAVLVVVALAAAVWRRRRISTQLVLIVCAAALLARGLFETEVWSFYLLPGVSLMAMAAARCQDRRTRRAVTVAAAAIYAMPCMAYVGVAMPALPYTEALAALSVVSVVALGRAEGRAGPEVAVVAGDGESDHGGHVDREDGQGDHQHGQGTGGGVVVNEYESQHPGYHYISQQ